MENRSGQTIIEALVAITVAVVGLLGVVMLVGRSLVVNNDTRAKFAATYLAAEGIEVVKNIIDTNYATKKPWNQGINTGSYKVSWDSSSLAFSASAPLTFQDGMFGYGLSTETPYTRIIDLVDSGSQISVSSKVSWLARGVPKSVVLQDTFFNWR